MKFIRPLLTIILVSLTFTSYGKEAKSPNIRLKAEIQKEGFTGEVFSYNITLISNTPEIANVKIIHAPSFPESVEIINGVTRNSRPEIKEEKGETLYEWNILKKFIIPEKAGKYEIGEAQFMAFIPEEKIVYDNFWGSFKTTEYKEVKLECKAVSFKVKSLPDANASASFSGCIGDFRIEGWFPPGKISTGTDSYAVFTISGYGSLENIKIPNLYKLFDKGCHLKEVEQTEERQQRDGKLYSEVTLSCIFVAEEEEFEILPLCLEFFNPLTKKYENQCSDKLHWTTNQSDHKNKIKSNDAIEI